MGAFHACFAVILYLNGNPDIFFLTKSYYTNSSTGFFIKKKSMNLIGNYNVTFKCSADYDLYYRLIIKYNLLGWSTNKRNLIGIVSKGGYSSKVSFIDHLVEETRIRVHNKQNYLLVYLIFFNALFKHILKKLKLI